MPPCTGGLAQGNPVAPAAILSFVRKSPTTARTLIPLALCGLAAITPCALAAAPGQVDTGFNPGVTGPGAVVNSVALQANGQVLLGGYFSGAGGVARSDIARVNADGSIDTGFSPGANGIVYSLVPQANGQILAGGTFTVLASSTRTRLARINADGSLDAGFTPSATNAVYTMVPQASGTVLLGGSLGLINGTARPRAARLTGAGALDSGFFPNPNADVRSITVLSNGQIILAGDFSYIGSDARNRIALLEADGTLVAGFDPDVGGTFMDPHSIVYAVAVLPDGKILVGGDFPSVGGITRTNMARLNADGSLDTSFIDPNIDARVASIAPQSDGKILIGGAFTSVGGVSRKRLARLNADGSLDTTFADPNADANTVESVVIQPDGKVLVGGGFTQIGGVARDRIARLYGAPPAAAPSVAGATAGQQQATVSWTGVPGDIASYTVTSSPGGGTCTATAPATSCTVAGLTAGTAYTFTVKAGNEFGSGPASGATAAVTPTAPAAAPGTAPSGSTAGSSVMARPATLAGTFHLRKGIGTTTGTVPSGVTSITQAATTGVSAATQGFLEMARAKTAKGKCTISRVSTKKKRAAAPRTYSCTIALSKGAWTITTTARGATGVVAQGVHAATVR